jgi:prepilin-type N-terminal cleavage/methylation domain-containing protein
MIQSTPKPVRTRRGFTLPEILVSITLIAVLAAVVVPTIASQVKRGDPARIGQDYVAVRGAVEQFLTDVRKYPGDFASLQTGISGVSPLSGTSNAAFSTSEIARWRGPYLNRNLTQTGYAGAVRSTFDNELWASNSNVACNTTNCGVRYLALAIAVAVGDTATAVELDAQFDDGDTKNGNIRFRKCSTSSCSPSTAPDTIKLLLLPVH